MLIVTIYPLLNVEETIQDLNSLIGFLDSHLRSFVQHNDTFMTWAVYYTPNCRLVRITQNFTLPHLTIANGTTLFIDSAAANIEIRIKCLYVLGTISRATLESVLINNQLGNSMNSFRIQCT